MSIVDLPRYTPRRDIRSRRATELLRQLGSEDVWELVPVQEDQATMMIFSRQKAEELLSQAKSEGVILLPTDITHALLHQAHVMSIQLDEVGTHLSDALPTTKYFVALESCRCFILITAIKEAFTLLVEEQLK